MRTFDYVRAAGTATAIAEAGKPETKFLAGGTTHLDLMKLQKQHNRFATGNWPAGKPS